MILDRTLAPEPKPIDDITLIQPEKHTLPNGLTIYSIRAGKQEVSALELYFKAGTAVEEKTGAANLLSKWITEGTKSHPKESWGEAVASLGAYYETAVSYYHFKISFYTLSNRLSELLPLLFELLTEPSFDPGIFKLKQRQLLQNREVNLKKTSYRAAEAFKQKLFGKSHLFGQSLDEMVLGKLSEEAPISHFHTFLRPGNLEIFLSGLWSNDEYKLVEEAFAHLDATPSVDQILIDQNFPINYDGQEIVQMPEAQQSSLRMGRRIFSKTHPEAPAFQLLNAAFGGYFGSRLMKNIREEKGYTYGIYSRFQPLPEGGKWFIASDLVSEFAGQALEEVENELKKLCEEPIPEKELQTVKNYLLGSLLNSIDSPFAHMEKFKQVHFYGMDLSYYDELVNAIKFSTPATLQELADKYLNPSQMAVVIAGNH